ncbi:MAG: copper homeostasis protein CutC, partial [Pyrinomonadaceae bacterium]
MNLTLEVIACSVADAVEAERGGAGRLEIIRSFERGGLTPPFELVRDILAAVRIPVRVMLRESESYAAADEAETERLCAAARKLAALRVDGLVLGFLRGGEIDVGLTERILSCAPDLKATFHHAFEEADDQFQAIRTLKRHRQIDRILTAGGQGDWPQKIARLASYE